MRFKPKTVHGNGATPTPLLDLLPQHSRDLVLFALSTGLRQSNVLTLEWSQVDLERRVVWFYGDQMKNKLDHHVSLNDTAMEVLCRQVGKHSFRVFTYKGKPIANANTRVWRKALVAAGIENFRWHDLRHCWASWLVQNGTPLYAVQEMGGLEVSSNGAAVRTFEPCQLGASCSNH